MTGQVIFGGVCIAVEIGRISDANGAGVGIALGISTAVDVGIGFRIDVDVWDFQ